MVRATPIHSLHSVRRMVDRVSLFRANERSLGVSPTVSSPLSPQFIRDRCAAKNGNPTSITKSPALQSTSDGDNDVEESASSGHVGTAVGALSSGIVSLHETEEGRCRKLSVLAPRFPVILTGRMACRSPEALRMVVAADLQGQRAKGHLKLRRPFARWPECAPRTTLERHKKAAETAVAVSLELLLPAVGAGAAAETVSRERASLGT